MPTESKSEYRAPALNALSATLGLARDTTSNIPIVNQILTITVAIVSLIQKVEKDKEALYALAEKAGSLTQHVQCITVDRPVDGELKVVLEKLTMCGFSLGGGFRRKGGYDT
ncbi:hypothetical protein EXIGLDRAFT_773734 [Exidia glandulosa HHB12029]|uniref:Uncharacterized protein n=1 Tax=Exidia glandulosa HHB12029 TaxID=1314781 RepID=A0A165ENG2_EXIGL|nr:hypothetical protein EXIGLDRAFT_773734 [Exidia glandulosa HHB12029]